MKITEGGRDMVEKIFQPFPETQKPVCSQGLHEALRRSFPKIIPEAGLVKTSFQQPVIKGQEFFALTVGKIHIGIAEERAKIVEGASEAHPLEVD